MNDKENTKFNPADYAYLDDKDFPMAGWMWEFIRRSPDYNQRYNQIKKLSETAVLKKTSIGIIYDKYEFTKSSDGNILHDALRDLEKKCFVRPLVIMQKNNVSDTFILMHVSKLVHKSKYICDIYIGIPNPNLGYCDFKTKKPFICGVTSVSYHRFMPEAIHFYQKEKYHKAFARIFRDKLTHENLENTLYLGISLKANIEEIKKGIKDILRQNIKLKDKRMRPTEWKYYLMVYELEKNTSLTFKQISKKLSEPVSIMIEDVEKLEKEVTDEKKKKRLEKRKTELYNLYANISNEVNIRNYHGQAIKWINHEVKEFIKSY